MTEITSGNSGLLYTHERLNTGLDAGNLQRAAILQEQVPEPGAAISPEEAAAIAGYFNRALQDTDRLRFPLLPNIVPPARSESAQQESTSDIPHEPSQNEEEDPTSARVCSNSTVQREMLSPELSSGQAQMAEPDNCMPVGHDTISDPKRQDETEFSQTSLPDKTYYHGSPEEKVLIARLDNAKKSGKMADIRNSRESLKSYWRKIVDEEYLVMPRSEFPAEVKRQKKNFKYSPDDSFVQYRIHALAKRAKESGYTTSLKEIERIRNGAWSGTSPTGTAISDFAVKNAKPENSDGGDCYAYVADALDSVDIRLTGEHAYMAADQLASHPKVREIKGLRAEQLTSLPKGAIVVWDRDADNIHGHISISQGNGMETSDLVRNQITDYGTTCRVFMPLDMIEE